MNSSNNPVQGTQVARFACDYCRQKKFRCSRELPKCSACLPWPGPCNYSRDRLKSAPTQSQPSSVPTQGQPGTQGNEPTPQLAVTRIDLTVESRLCSIEHKLERLASLVEKAVLRAASEKESESDAQTPSRANQASSQTDSRIPKLFIGESHSFSFVREATENLRSTPGIPGPSSRQEADAQSELQFLSTSLTTATLEPGHNSHMSGLHVPSRAIGYKLIGTFLEHAPKGEPFFVTPSEELLNQIVFNPDKVSQKAWLVYFNYIMLAQVSPEKEDHGEEAARFRQNMRMALNDSRIFLEPRQVNVQALALLAVHGEDYASPNLSWMLVGHACRQAEALGLHLPTPRDVESYQRSLSMFWLLFVLDKSCALAFGRSPFLPMKLYQEVPLPDISYLLKFQPHLDSDFSSAPPAARPSEFGAHFFIRGIELARIMGSVVDTLATGSSPSSRETIKLQLEEWSNQTKRILDKIMDSDRHVLEPTQLKEMSLGLNSLRFQYLHVVIVLLKGDKSSSNQRLECAREALFILPSIVSNWSSVYNGVVWHLLYYPFIPFFVVFENLVHSSTFQASATIDHDLSLLATTVSYFSGMRDQMQLLAVLCSRLENVAFVFLELARRHIQHRHATINKTLDSSWPPLHSRAETNVEEVAVGDSLPGFSQGTLDDFALGDGLDIGNFLNWLPADIFTSGPSLGLESRQILGSASSGPEVSSTADLRGRKRPFDATFDWFSWDAYYADMHFH
ncbi:hypothetical protein CCUS01_09137 [Colletotrichum cuscutae]|uniref:Zn(2)-C6 fungal-type domain-containing protein n=1 Tax=Colletotrichum cuscutae TaxID=1209917 RepID=A0AAI9UJR3_9PEZI|nr:hypothetical protein CCUS01_09137 [Colletotrichum cuscutae]